MTSIRTRITSAVVGCTALVVAVAALIAGTTARTMLVKGLDDRLRGRARAFSVVWRPPPGTPSDARDGRESREFPREWRDFQPSPEQQQAFQQATSSWLYQARDAESGDELMRASSLPKEASLADFGMKPGDPIRTVRLPDGRPFRLLAIASESVTRMWPWSRDGSRDGARDGNRDGSREPTTGETPPTPTPTPTPPDRRAAITWLAVDASDLESEGRRLSWILAAVWAGATLLAWGAAFTLARTVLRPVESLSRTIQALSPTNLAARVPMATVPAELSSVVSRLNALLERVEAAFQRERATIGNMAHELRNPISALRATLEFGLFQGLSPQQRKTLESSLALTVRMQELVNGLLTLTRIEAGQEVLAREQVDVVALLREAWTTVEARAEERGMAAQWRLPDELPLVTSPAHLELVAVNLLENAVAHGAVPGAVEIDLSADAERAELRISNSCADARESSDFFQPFWRSDPARTGTRHFGLGLALCDRIVRLLGGTIEARQEERRFTVAVTFPRSAAAHAPPVAVAPRGAV